MQSLPDSRDAGPLRAHFEHAERLARVLAALYDSALPGDPARLWLTGRADEIGAFVADVRDAWMQREVTTVRACDSITRYLRSLHRSLESWYGSRFTPSCCDPHGLALESGIRPGARPDQTAPSPACDTVPEGTPGAGAYRLVRVSSSSSW